MANQVIQGERVYLDGYYISSDINAITLKMTADTPECTTLADTWKARKPGLCDVDVSMEGYVDVADGGIDGRLSDGLALADVPLMIGVTTGLVDTPAYFLETLEASYTPGGKVGDMMAFSMAANGDGAACVRGQIIHNSARTSTGNGTGYSVGQQPAGQDFHMQLQVYGFTASGGSPTLDVTVQAGVDATFATPFTIGSFTQVVAVGAEHKVIALADMESLYGWTDDADDAWTDDADPAWGIPQTHTYMRATYTLANLTTTSFAVSAGFK